LPYLFKFEGEAFKEKFEGIQLSDAATESVFIRSNGKFTAVRSFTLNFRFLGKQEAEECSLL